MTHQVRRYLVLASLVLISSLSVIPESHAQPTFVRKDTGGTLVGTNGDPTSGQMDASGNLRVNIAAADGSVTVGAVSPTTNATFGALALITAATLDGTYRTVVDLPDGTKYVQIDNQTNGDILISMDGGSSDTYHVKAGDVQPIYLAPSGLVTTAIIQAKDGTTASTAGSLYVTSIK